MNSSPDLDPIPLGPFDILERIGAGGMGAVYRATHRTTGTEVAVKVVRGEPDDRALRRFRREVQAHAALLHPAIVQLIEYGAVDEAAADASDGALTPGSPYVGMELADGPTIRAVEIASWAQLRRVLEQVLGALGHAHARGVVHRDLKPDNLLAFSDGDDWNIKLTDFGIAHALASIGERGQESLRAVIGTPKYMAPEQLLGRWREHGPWTDLYALGCVAYAMATGKAPHEELEGGGVRQAVAHLSSPPAELAPRFAVPEELRDWIRTAMAVAPEDRFQRANEALAALPDAGAPTTFGDSSPAPPEQGRTGPYPAVEIVTADTVALPPAERNAAPVEAPRPTTDLAPPPDDWRRPSAGQPNPIAGPGLVGLRQPAFVGREAERDAIWTAFRRAVTEHRLEVVLLEGEAGIGKTRLAEWTMTLAHEIASANVLRLDDFTRSADGLEETLRTWMMTREQVYAHLRATLPPLEAGDPSRDYDARALTALLRPPSSNRREGGPGFAFSSPREKLLVLERLVRRLSTTRPTIASFDDLHDAGAALDLLEHFLDGDRSRNLLLLGTVRSDIVAARPQLASRLEALAERSDVQRLVLGPLSEDAERQLARQLTGSPSAAAVLAERMEGNPLFGVQLLTDWVERGLMRTAEEPAPSPEELDGLPADIHAVWLERIRRLEADVDDPGQFRRSLELASILGKSVTREDWDAVFPHATDFEPWEQLVARGLARATETGWQFVHGLLVKSLHRLAREAGRWTEHHRRCGQALESTFRREPLRVARRLADHWIAAGRPERALAPLLEEAERLEREDTLASRREVLLLRSKLLDELGVPDDDLQRVTNDLELLRNDFRAGRVPPEVYQETLSLLERISSRNAPGLEAKAWRLAARCLEGQAEMASARECASKAIAAAERGGHRRELAMAKMAHAGIDLRCGREDRTRQMAVEVRELAEELDDRYLALRACQIAAWSASTNSDHDRAGRLFSDALRQAREVSARVIEADAHNGLGDTARARGDSATAIEHYRQAIVIFEQMQRLDDAAVGAMNLAAAEIDAGQYQVAGARLEEAAQCLEEYGYSFFHSHLNAYRLALAAGTADWTGFDRALASLDATLQDGGELTSDILWQVRLALRLAGETGEAEKSEAARDFEARLARDLERRRSSD